MPQISDKELEELRDKAERLDCLEAGGVDNWEWFDESMKPYRKRREQDEKLDEIITEIMESIHSEIEEPAGRGTGYGLSDVGVKILKSIISRVIYEAKNSKDSD